MKVYICYYVELFAKLNVQRKYFQTQVRYYDNVCEENDVFLINRNGIDYINLDFAHVDLELQQIV